MKLLQQRELNLFSEPERPLLELEQHLLDHQESQQPLKDQVGIFMTFL